MLEGSRTFDLAWGAVTAAICFGLGSTVIALWVSARRTNGASIFGRALDPERGLQLAWGIFAMGMGGTNAGCRFIDHRYLSAVHEGFFALTLLVIGVLTPAIVTTVRTALERASAHAAR